MGGAARGGAGQEPECPGAGEPARSGRATTPQLRQVQGAGAAVRTGAGGRARGRTGRRREQVVRREGAREGRCRGGGGGGGPSRRLPEAGKPGMNAPS